MPHLVRGDCLNDAARIDVLAAFVYRWTIENERQARAAQPDCQLPLVTDAEWLRSHASYITRAGRLALKPARCEPATSTDYVPRQVRLDI